jgi:DNA-binding PadR family transcriptional regulator
LGINTGGVVGKFLMGEFEHLVLLTAIRLGDDAYGVSIARALTEQIGKEVSQAATYLTLKRLEEKGWLEATDGVPSTVRGGRAKRTYRITEAGMAKVRESRATLLDLWDEISGQLQ